ncbi:beta-L-arabinofuranosidase domain-containing protein [Paraflavitalea sp. CAU 1676]|uniref:glycoside hydrolase family 127 protein n=1 Tax=Paraflavitalea sp. CAU 1676 TaxID=3032598 RepID=UPI0023DB6EED|nr:beta-L-arabinofuranosidase domain-containing protein [Paraflavitalea sp. CAU 1676]MDF2188126.1 glycoside hydrolase family 127 protein [Paraflavitalea sp. CAU 1676]
MLITRTVKRGSLAALIAIGAASSDGFSQPTPAAAPSPKPNLAIVATPAASGRFGASLDALNDGLTPTPSGNNRGGGRRFPRSQFWVEYQWAQPVTTSEIAVYWWDYSSNLRLPEGYRIQYWDGNAYVPVKNASGLGLANNQYNKTSFDEIKTTKIRLELDSADRATATLLEWAVYQSPNSPTPAPVVLANGDRDVMVGGRTWLSSTIKSVTPVGKTSWIKVSGPGAVNFSNSAGKDGTATFTSPGNYVLQLTAGEGKLAASSTIKVKVHMPPKDKRLDVVYTKRYKIDSKLWSDRAKAMIVNWIPWCIDQCERTDLTTGEGGLDNFIEAAKALRGEPHAKHKGYVFSNAWVHQTIESICIALMVDPQGDAAVIASQERMKASLEKWIPIILAAQEPDGYLHTAYTLRDTARWKERWAVRNRGDHEGYVAGYFIESAINHYTLTEGRDKRLYDAAKKLADCWVANIGPGKKAWYDGHQEMEQALVRFGRFVNDMEGKGSHGDSYINLAKFLLDNRKDGSEYDQSHVPVQQQYEAVGHAVRATYNYSAMADVAAETGDVDYQSAVMSLWDNMINKKYYLTGGIGSGETSEGFGGNYSLRNSAYCESCSSAGLIFFQYKMNLAYHDAKYADLYEESMYNALLGSIDLEGKNFLYTNPLSSAQARYQWHVCPCCVGNIPRTLLMIPTWTYVTGDKGIYVNMYVGSTIKVERVVGTDVEMVQKTDYPWSGHVAITVNPKVSKSFTVYVRVPNRTTSELYTPVPAVSGLKSLKVNGKAVPVKIENGYVAITRTWKAGDKIEVVLPMDIQKIRADDKIEADRGRVALRVGPLIYNVETQDNNGDINRAIGKGPLTMEWKPTFLNGVMTIKGTWSDGTPLIAIPNYARLNRLATTPVPSNENQTAPTRPNEPPQARMDRTAQSAVWIKEEGNK